MKYTRESIAARIGDRGYLDLVSIFLAMGFENIHDVPEMLWAVAVQIYEKKMFENAA